MNVIDFSIGMLFRSGNGLWRCTDVGTRVVVAIRIDRAEIATLAKGAVTTRVVERVEAEAIGWFSGPSYGVVEVVFDEDDMEGCSLDDGEGFAGETGTSPREA